jgi:hypothetical protein
MVRLGPGQVLYIHQASLNNLFLTGTRGAEMVYASLNNSCGQSGWNYITTVDPANYFGGTYFNPAVSLDGGSTLTGMDRVEARLSPDGTRVYMTSRVDGVSNFNQALFYSTDNGTSWTAITSPQSSTLSPFTRTGGVIGFGRSQFVYLFGCNDFTNSTGAAGLTVLEAYDPVLNRVYTGSTLQGAPSCSTVGGRGVGGVSIGSAGIAGRPGVGDGNDVMRVAFPQKTSGGQQVETVMTIEVSPSGSGLSTTVLSQETVSAASANGSVFQFTMVEPDGLTFAGTPRDHTDTQLMYWDETTTTVPISTVTDSLGSGNFGNTVENSAYVRGLGATSFITRTATLSTAPWPGWLDPGDQRRAGATNLGGEIEFAPQWSVTPLTTGNPPLPDRTRQELHSRLVTPNASKVPEIFINVVDPRTISNMRLSVNFDINGNAHTDWEDLGTIDSDIYTNLYAQGMTWNGSAWVGNMLYYNYTDPNVSAHDIRLFKIDERPITNLRVTVNFTINGACHTDYEDIGNWNTGDGDTTLTLDARGGTFNGQCWVGDFLHH